MLRFGQQTDALSIITISTLSIVFFYLSYFSIHLFLVSDSDLR